MSQGSVHRATSSRPLYSSLPVSSIAHPPTPPSTNNVIHHHELGPKLKQKTDASATKQRIAIATLYFNSYASSPLHLKGRGGILSQIAKRLNAPPSVVNRVVQQCISSESRREVYNARRKKFTREYLHKIKRGSIEEHLLSVYKENHYSYRATTDLLNAIVSLRSSTASSDHTYISKTSVYHAVQRMRHRKLRTVTISQASNRNKHWQQARLNYFAQLLVRYRLPLPVIDPSFRIEHVLTICDRRLLERENLMLSPSQIAWWDEIHLYQVIGCMQDSTLVFPRDTNGVYDPSITGKYREKDVVSAKLHILYNKQMYIISLTCCAYLPFILDKDASEIRRPMPS